MTDWAEEFYKAGAKATSQTEDNNLAWGNIMEAKAKLSTPPPVYCDIILLTALRLEGVLRRRYKGRWYAIINKWAWSKISHHLFSEEAKATSLPGEGIPVIEDKDLVFKVITDFSA